MTRDIGNPKNVKIIGKTIAKFEIEFIDFGVWDDTSTPEALAAYEEWLVSTSRVAHHLASD